MVSHPHAGTGLGRGAELEQTYTYVCAFKPELIGSLYETAQRAARRQKNLAADAIKVRGKGRPKNRDTNQYL
jgi:hypothetical protein